MNAHPDMSENQKTTTIIMRTSRETRTTRGDVEWRCLLRFLEEIDDDDDAG